MVVFFIFIVSNAGGSLTPLGDPPLLREMVDDPVLSWEARYARLLLHHEEETKFLIARIEALEAQLDERGR